VRSRGSGILPGLGSVPLVGGVAGADGALPRLAEIHARRPTRDPTRFAGARSRSSKANRQPSSVQREASAKTWNAPWGITGIPKPTSRISSIISLCR